MFIANEMTGFNKKCNTGLKWDKVGRKPCKKFKNYLYNAKITRACQRRP